jgi:hypothetical protein
MGAGGGGEKSDVILKIVYKKYMVISLFYVPYLHHEKSIPIIKRDELKQMIKKGTCIILELCLCINKIIKVIR